MALGFLRRPFLPSAVWAAGLVAFFWGEVLAGSPLTHWGGDLVGFLLVLAAPIGRAVRRRKLDPAARGLETAFLVLHALGPPALVLYALQSDMPAYLLGAPLLEHPRSVALCATLWPALLAVAALPTLTGEIARAGGQGSDLEPRRIRYGLLSGLSFALTIVLAASLTFAASERDRVLDLSYYRATRPGESTRRVVRSLTEPVEVALFFPPQNLVWEEVSRYFEDLRGESPKLEVQRHDFALARKKAQAFRVAADGTIVIARGAAQERWQLPLDFDLARPKLRSFDGEIQRRLITVTRPERVAYTVQGHRERAEYGGLDDLAGRGTMRELKRLVHQLGYKLTELSAANGLANEVPADAAFVLLLGPQDPLRPEEMDALNRYRERGGRLLVALDPEAGVAAPELLGPLGFTFDKATLANQNIFARQTGGPADRANILTAVFEDHPSVATLRKVGASAPLILPTVGSFFPTAKRPKGMTVIFTVVADAATWKDDNGNFNFDPPGEIRESFPLVAAVAQKSASGKEARVVVVADSDVVTDPLLTNRGNQIFTLDVVRWIAGEEGFVGEVSTEKDVAILHTGRSDVAWFYGTIFLAPAVAIGIGLGVTRRRRKGTAKA